MLKTRYLLEFSHENQEASETELSSLEETYSSFHTDLLEEGFAVVTGSISDIRNASFVNRASRILSEETDYKDFTGENLPAGTFYIRLLDMNSCHSSSLEKELGNLLGAKGRVSFHDPDFKVRIFHSDKWYLTVLEYERDKKDMESRRAPLRPFFSPVSIHPKYARYLVNLSGTKPGEILMDPFCGTGGILLEAAITGRKVIGNDMSLNMVMGAKLNLKYFGVKDYEIYNSDILELDYSGRIDGIATDMPYGRNSFMKHESIVDLYSRSFEKFHEILKDNGKCSIAISDEDHIDGIEDLFRIRSRISIMQHKSLTRHFITLQKI